MTNDDPVRTLTEARTLITRLDKNLKRLLERRVDWLPTIEEARTLLEIIADEAGLSLDDLVFPAALRDLYDPDFEGCSVEELHQGLTVIGTTVARKPAELIQRARQAVQETVRMLNKAEREAAPERARLQMAHLLGREKQMEILMRAESHAAKQLRQAMHELEARQACRRGERAPLARLDIGGMG